MQLDHVVIWVADPLKSAEWFIDVVGLQPVRVDLYAKGEAPFPSVRVNENSIIDLSPLADADAVNSMTKTGASAGHPVNHICIDMGTREAYEALAERLGAKGVDTSARRVVTYGARGDAPHAFYFQDLDGNVIEARYYD